MEGNCGLKNENIILSIVVVDACYSGAGRLCYGTGDCPGSRKHCGACAYFANDTRNTGFIF